MAKQYGILKVDTITYTSGETGLETDVSVDVSGLATYGVTGISTTGTISGNTITDGVAILTAGDLTNVNNITASGTITDGTTSLTGGNITGTNNITCTGIIAGETLTDGTTSLTGGDITGANNITANGTIEGDTLTDGTTSLTGGDITGVNNITSTGNVQGNTLTDGTTSLTGGNITGANNITSTGTIQANTLTDGTTSLTNGDITGVNDITSTGTVSSVSGVFSDNALFGDGSVTEPSVSFINDPDTGFYSPGADQLAFAVAGVQVIFVDANGDFTFTVNGATKLPVGTAAQRPGTPAAGMFRFNDDTDVFEGYDGLEWNTVGDIRTSDIGTDPEQIPLNQYLGKQAFIDEVGTIRPSASPPQQNLDITFEYVSDTSINVKMRGADGVVRSSTLTLS